MPEPLFEVVEGGILATVQDAGRPAWTHLGVPLSGAADPWGLVLANLLVGNEPGAAVIEMTVGGPTLRTIAAVTIGLAGADIGGRVDSGRRLVTGRTHHLAAGEIASFGGAAQGHGAGSRAYVAVPGGVAVPEVLGSRSTCLAAAFGGLDGRPLAAGDVVLGERSGTLPERIWPEDDPAPDTDARMLRVISGPS